MQTGERSIFERGCLRAGEEWLELNMVPVAGAAVSTMVLQVLYLLKTVVRQAGKPNFLFSMFCRVCVDQSLLPQNVLLERNNQKRDRYFYFNPRYTPNCIVEIEKALLTASKIFEIV